MPTSNGVKCQASKLWFLNTIISYEWQAVRFSIHLLGTMTPGGFKKKIVLLAPSLKKKNSVTAHRSLSPQGHIATQSTCISQTRTAGALRIVVICPKTHNFILPRWLPSLDGPTPSSLFLMAKATFEVVLPHVSPVAVSNLVEIIKPSQFELRIGFCSVRSSIGYLTSVTHS